MNRLTTTPALLGLLVAGGMMLFGTQEAKAQYYGGTYVSGYSYSYAPTCVVTPAPVVVRPAPVVYAPVRTYYYPSRHYYSRRVVRYGHRGYHRYHPGHHGRGFSFGFSYHD